MNILFISQYFYPENFKGNDLVFALSEYGYNVTVITGIPNYPKGDFYGGYSLFKKSRETINGVKIIRLPLIPRKSGKRIWLALNYFSFFISQLFYYLLSNDRKVFDVVITQQLSPLTSSLAAVWYKKKYKIKLITWVLDLWPESVIVNSNLKKGLIINFLERIAKFLYLQSDYILISSNSFKESIENKVNKKDIIFFPNWAEKIYSEQVCNFHFPKLSDGFNIVFAGNLGETQDFESLLKCIYLLKDEKGINWNFVGDGRFKNRLEKMVANFNLKNIFIYPNYPIDYMPSLFAQADALLLTLIGGDSLVSRTIPGKLQSYMASGKLIIGMIDGEANQIIKESSSGFAVNAGDFKGLSDIVLKASKLSESERSTYANNAMKYYHDNFSREKVIGKIDLILKSIKNNHCV